MYERLEKERALSPLRRRGLFPSLEGEFELRRT